MEQALRDKLAIFSHNAEAPRPEEVRRNEKTRSAAYQDGYKAGIAEAQKNAADKTAEIESIMRTLPGMVERLAADIEASHARAVTAALKAALPRLAEKAAADEVLAVIMETARGDGNGTVEVRASIPFSQELAPILAQITSQTNIRLVPDSGLNGYAIRLSWDGGGGEMDISGMVDKCLGLIDRALVDQGTPER